MKITIVYDNTSFNDNLQADWGFACIIEIFGLKILFDTGAKGHILLNNMKKLCIDPMEINMVFISHFHWDHTGGLLDFFNIHPVQVYIPHSFLIPINKNFLIPVNKSLMIHENIYSTGVLDGIEQSLVIKYDNKTVVIAGCSHPGVGKILESASKFGKAGILVGGLHGFNDFDLIQDLDYVCPTHCTRYISDIQLLYPEKYIKGGAGRVIKI